MCARHFTIYDTRSGKWHAYHNNQKLVGEYNTKQQADQALDVVVRKRAEPEYSAPTPLSVNFSSQDKPPTKHKKSRVSRLVRLRKERKQEL